MIRRLWQYLRELARELSDEGAYARHLSHAGMPHSRKEWQRFIDARLRRKYQNGRCC